MDTVFDARLANKGATVARLVLVGIFLTLVGAYARLAPLTAEMVDKDWHHLWLGGRMVVTGHADRLYDPDLQIAVYRKSDPLGESPPVWRPRNHVLGCFNYPPPAALGYATLAWMPMRTAAVVNAYLNLALAVFIAWRFARGLAPHVAWPAAAVAILAHPAFFYNLGLGQNAVWSLAVILGAWCLANRRRDLLAGMLLGLLICKPNWLVAVGWIPLIHRRWRLAAGIGLGTLIVAGGTALLLGLQPFLEYREQFSNVSRIHELPGYDLIIKYSAMGLFRKWLGPSSSWANGLAWTSSLILVAATWWTTRGAWKPGTARFRRLIAGSLAAVLWINPHLNYYDLLLGGPAVFLLLADWKAAGRRARLLLAALALLVFAALPWDRHWPWGEILPVPCFALLALWAWSAAGCRPGNQAGRYRAPGQLEAIPANDAEKTAG